MDPGYEYRSFEKQNYKINIKIIRIFLQVCVWHEASGSGVGWRLLTVSPVLEADTDWPVVSQYQLEADPRWLHQVITMTSVSDCDQ